MLPTLYYLHYCVNGFCCSVLVLFYLMQLLKFMLTRNDAKFSEHNDSNSVLSKHSDNDASNDPFVANNNEPVQENINNKDFFVNDQSTRQ